MRLKRAVPCIVVGVALGCMPSGSVTTSGQTPKPRYSCVDSTRARPDVSLPLAKKYAGGRLSVFAASDPSASSWPPELLAFDDLLTSCLKKHKDAFEATLDEIEALPSDVSFYLYDHPAITLARGAKDSNDIDRYFLRMNDVLQLPSDAPSHASWATTRCHVLLHELKEVQEWSHADGIARENQIRSAKYSRTGNAELRHDDHCDVVIPLGDELERYHLEPDERRIASISYQ